MTKGDIHSPSALLGLRIKHLRKKNGWTLQALSDATGVAISTLSKVERGQISPSYEKFMAVAQAFGITLNDLLNTKPALLRDENIQLGNVIDYSILGADYSNKTMTPVAAVIPPVDLNAVPEFTSHLGEKFVYVLEGEILIHFQSDENIHLCAGQSFYFNGVKPHMFGAASPLNAKIILVCQNAN